MCSLLLTVYRRFHLHLRPVHRPLLWRARLVSVRELCALWLFGKLRELTLNLVVTCYRRHSRIPRILVRLNLVQHGLLKFV